jgi:hypothetical protein
MSSVSRCAFVLQRTGTSRRTVVRPPVGRSTDHGRALAGDPLTRPPVPAGPGRRPAVSRSRRAVPVGWPSLHRICPITDIHRHLEWQASTSSHPARVRPPDTDHAMVDQFPPRATTRRSTVTRSRTGTRASYSRFLIGRPCGLRLTTRGPGDGPSGRGRPCSASRGSERRAPRVGPAARDGRGACCRRAAAQPFPRDSLVGAHTYDAAVRAEPPRCGAGAASPRRLCGARQQCLAGAT